MQCVHEMISFACLVVELHAAARAGVLWVSGARPLARLSMAGVLSGALASTGTIVADKRGL
jgi:hypothetical protein